MIIGYYNFSTIIVSVKWGYVVRYSLCKIILVNNPIKNYQGLSTIMGIVLVIRYTTLTSIHVQYSNIICYITLEFLCAINTTNNDTMKHIGALSQY